jgi:hypothetical protein
MAATNFDPYDRDEPVPTSFGRRRRGGLGYFTLFVGGMAVIAMGVVGVFAYTAGERHGAEAVAPTIVAGAGPEKMRPEAPGGMEVPNQDKQIFERMAPPPRGQQPPQRVERLLPPPEAPMPPPRPPVIEQIPRLNAPPPAPQVAPAPELMRPRDAIEAPPPTGAPPAEPQQQTEKIAPAPTPKEIAKATSAAPAAGVAGGAYRVQIASLRSPEDAQAAIARMKKANGDLFSGLAFDVKRADLADKGVYYRVQVGPLADASAANALCDRLKDRKLGCVIVRP